MSEIRTAALKAQAALATLLALDKDYLWPDDARALRTALNIVQRLAR